MTQLIDALITAYKADTGAGGLMTLTTGIKQNPAAVMAFNYVTISALPSGTTPTYGDHDLGELDVTFSVWCNSGPTDAGAIADALIAKFKNLLPTLARGRVLNVRLAQPPLYMVQSQKDETQSTVVMIPVQFHYSVEMW